MEGISKTFIVCWVRPMKSWASIKNATYITKKETELILGAFIISWVGVYMR